MSTRAARVFVPDVGPCVARVEGDTLMDVTPAFPTMRDLCEEGDPVKALRSAKASRIGLVEDAVANAATKNRDGKKPWLLTPIDLQAIKAAGVTFVVSMIERVIEERARGNAEAAKEIRQHIRDLVGDDLRKLKPGSKEAQSLKDTLIKAGAWSQYLEVGIGPDAEIFTKGQPMSAVGTMMDVGIHPKSVWNNPEPEVVLVVSSKGTIVGATLGNDVNLRDVEGRSALLLGKAKDNNSAASVGPFIRFFDEGFDMDSVRRMELSMEVVGEDGFVMKGHSSLSEISRDPADIVGQAINEHHNYPDGLVVYLGTMFAPSDDRDHKGRGFTHKTGDIVTISSPELGSLSNRVVPTDKTEKWTMGTRALFANLGGRGLLKA
jgi:fumarylacetoacetate (FAA) hydrolase family protein